MANKAAAKKYLRASQRRRMRNKPVRSFARSTVRTAHDAIDDAIDTNQWTDAEEAIRRAVSALDRAAQKGVVHANTAARRKSRLLRRFHALQHTDTPPRRRIRPPEPAKTA